VSRWAAARRWLAAWRGVPARAERADRFAQHAAVLVEEVRAEQEVRRVEESSRDARLDATLDGLGTTLGMLFAESRGRHEDVHGWFGALADRMPSLHHDLRVNLEATLAPGRDRAAAELVESHRHRGPRRPGASVLTITWNHAGWIREAAASAAATLDALGDRAGVHLVLDDCSSDETAAVLDELAVDPRVVVVRSPVNLNLARARNVLLAACPTEHVVVLDADNRLLPDGVLTVLEVAERYRPVLAWGQVLAAADDGTGWDAFGFAPAWETLTTGICFDSMAVVDVAAVEALGGYSTDPRLAGVVDDLELLLRTVRRGGLVTYVPTVLGRYRSAPLRHSAQAPDHRRALAHVERLHLYDAPDPGEFPVAAIHPATGVLWAWRGARTVLGRPEVEPAVVDDPDPPSPDRILVVAPGGVDNLGDDAITWSVLDRIAATHPSAAVEVLSDRDLPPQRPGRPVVPLAWNGSVAEWWSSVSGSLRSEIAAHVGVAVSRFDPVAPSTRPGAPLDLSSYDLVVVAGGGNLASPFADGVLQARLALAACADLLGVPVIWSGQGIGPLEPDQLDLVRRVLGRSAAVSCRDPGSVGLLDGLPAVELVGDDAVGVPARTHPIRVGLAGRPHVVVHVRAAPYVTSDRASLVASVETLAAEHDAVVVGLVVDGNGGGERVALESLRSECSDALEWVVVDVRGDPEGAVDLLAHASAVLAHSFHVALWSLAAGTPASLVAGNDYYAAKAAGLDAAVGLDGGVGLPVPWDPADLPARHRRLAGVLRDGVPGLRPEAVDTWLGARLAAVLSGVGPRT